MLRLMESISHSIYINLRSYQSNLVKCFESLAAFDILSTQMYCSDQFKVLKCIICSNLDIGISPI